MNYSLDLIKEYTKQLESYGDVFTNNDVEEFVGGIEIETRFSYEFGATKLVLIPYDVDYVIKIPFTGEYNYKNYFEFENAYDYKDGNDYCMAEVFVYRQAKKIGYGDIFLPIEKVLTVGNFSIYVQPKCIFSRDKGNIVKPSQASIEAIKNQRKIRGDDDDYCWRLVNSCQTNWLASCLETLGSLEKFKNFAAWFKEYPGSNDLHSMNIGYYNNHAVIVDYAGYSD